MRRVTNNMFDYSAPVLSPIWVFANFNYDEDTGDVSRKSDGFAGTLKLRGSDRAPSRSFFVTKVDGRNLEIPAYTIAWIMLGRPELAPGETIDHADRDTLNNRPDNLRAASKTQQSANRSRVRSRRHDLPKGVTLSGSNGRIYRATIRRNGKKQHLGTSDCPAERHFAYLVAADRTFGQFATPGWRV
jgi:hypothetical protein